MALCGGYVDHLPRTLNRDFHRTPFGAYANGAFCKWEFGARIGTTWDCFEKLPDLESNGLPNWDTLPLKQCQGKGALQYARSTPSAEVNVFRGIAKQFGSRSRFGYPSRNRVPLLYPQYSSLCGLPKEGPPFTLILKKLPFLSGSFPNKGTPL